MFGRRSHGPAPGARGRRLLLFAGLLAVVVVGRGAAEAAGRWRLAVNLTDSLPNWAFVIDGRDRCRNGGSIVRSRNDRFRARPRIFDWRLDGVCDAAASAARHHQLRGGLRSLRQRETRH